MLKASQLLNSLGPIRRNHWITTQSEMLKELLTSCYQKLRK